MAPLIFHVLLIFEALLIFEVLVIKALSVKELAASQAKQSWEHPPSWLESRRNL